MNNLKNITVFCASRSGTKPEYIECAKQLGETLAFENIGLVYGGAKVGLMGAVADSVLENGGTAIGVLPRFLAAKKEVPHESLTKLILVNSMHQRKMKMYKLCDGFITLPGGFGTMDEFFEILSWNKMKIPGYKPLGILNVYGFYDPLIKFIDSMLKNEFINKGDRKIVHISSNISELLSLMRNDKNTYATTEGDLEKT